jgi:hypothetical protein
MSKANQERPSNESSKANDSKSIAISKIDIGSIKGGRITSEAPIKPEKPTKGNK